MLGLVEEVTLAGAQEKKKEREFSIFGKRSRQFKKSTGI